MDFNNIHNMSITERFYVADRPDADSTGDREWGTEAMRAVGCGVGDAPRCRTCGNLTGMRAWLPPYEVDLELWGLRFADVLFPGGGALLVSNSFRRIYQESGLTGLAAFAPVGIARITRRCVTDANAPEYFRAEVMHSQAAIDPIRSGCEYKCPGPICASCRRPPQAVIKRWSAVVIEEGTWGGEDVFVPRGGSCVMTSERFKVACERYKMCGIVFSAAESHCYDFYPWEAKGWALRLFDATLAILFEDRALDEHHEMENLRSRVALDPAFDWMACLRQRVGDRVDRVIDAASVAYYKLTRGRGEK